MKANIDAQIVDMTMIRVAETVLAFAVSIENGTRPDIGTVQTLKNLAKAIVEATDFSKPEAANDYARGY